ncbi:MAG TPA: hypothetical protein VM030_07790 [Acidimicrobiales bacterium]|nr:hypothetical protein [Acidimicrobiales bacterium]
MDGMNATARQAEQIERLVEQLGPDESARILRQFAGATHLGDVLPWLTRREASALVILLTVVASQQPIARTA